MQREGIRRQFCDRDDVEQQPLKPKQGRCHQSDKRMQSQSSRLEPARRGMAGVARWAAHRMAGTASMADIFPMANPISEGCDTAFRLLRGGGSCRLCIAAAERSSCERCTRCILGRVRCRSQSLHPLLEPANHSRQSGNLACASSRASAHCVPSFQLQALTPPPGRPSFSHKLSPSP
jgi:hypothetical protein